MLRLILETRFLTEVVTGNSMDKKKSREKISWVLTSSNYASFQLTHSIQLQKSNSVISPGLFVQRRRLYSS